MAILFLIFFSFINYAYPHNHNASVREFTTALAKVLNEHAKTDKDFAAAVRSLGSPNLMKMYKSLQSTVEFKMVEVYLNTLGLNHETQIFDLKLAMEVLHSRNNLAESNNVTFSGFTNDLLKEMPLKKIKKSVGDIFHMDRYAKICKVTNVKNVETLITWVQYTPIYWAIVHEYRKVELDLHGIINELIVIAGKNCKAQKPKHDEDAGNIA